jgi:tetratricopeptide (TPR) repeat protein
MMQIFDAPYPEWYVEGFAEFYSTPKFDHDGSVWFGVPANHRAYGLFNGPKMPVELLFGGVKPGMTGEQRDVFYGRSWLLTHYLLTGGKRDGQLVNYVRQLTKGASSIEAAREAFGDLGQLDRELDSYLRGQMVQFKIAASNIHVGAIDVTPLSEGAAQVIIARAKIKYGVRQPTDVLATQVRALEARYPGDSLVERTLAEAELADDHPEAAATAAERALKADPRSTEAMVLKGRALEAEAMAANDPDKADDLFRRARDTLIAANKLDTEDPEPLYEFYHSYVAEGRRPSDNALSALHYASDLAPQDYGVRVNSAIAYINEGKFKEARSTLAVVAYSPHSDAAGDVAKRMIADIDAGKGKATLLDLGAASRQQSGSH